MTFEEFKDSWYNNVLPSKPEYIRKGQGLMNYLFEVWPEEYKRISSLHYYTETNIDCFYNDQLFPNTMEHLRKVWKNYPE